MSMSLGGGKRRTMSEINVTPLVDVMLVLLVIFIVTAPLLTHAVKIDLPKASSAVNTPKRENIHLSIDAGGTVYWNGERVERDDLTIHMAESSRLDPQPELHIRADGELAYKQVVSVMSDASKAGLTRIGFVTNPRETP